MSAPHVNKATLLRAIIYQRNVHDHRPVGVEEDLADKDEDEGHDDPVLGEADADEEEGRGDDEADAADDRVDAGKPLAELETQPRTENEAEDARHGEHDSKDKRRAGKENKKFRSFWGSLILSGEHVLVSSNGRLQSVDLSDPDGVLHVERSPPGECAGGEGQAGEGDRRQEEGLVGHQVLEVIHIILEGHSGRSLGAVRVGFA